MFTFGGHTEVFAIAFSTDGKRLASGDRDRHVRLWDAENGNEMTARQEHGRPVLTVAYTADGKQLATASHDITKIRNAENADQLRSVKGHGSWARHETLRVSGPRTEKAQGYSFPMVFYTSDACNEQGVNYAYYEGTWDKLPDFDTLEPVEQGKLEKIDLSPRKKDQEFGMKFTGFVRVRSTEKLKFHLASDNGAHLYIDSQLVIDNDGNHTMEERKEGEIELAKGVHSVTLTYYQAGDGFGLDLTLPNTSVSAEELTTKRLRADALLGMGQNEQAKDILLALKPDAWPIPEKTLLNLTSDLRGMEALRPVTDTDTAETMNTINSWLHRHPMLRMDSEFMSSKTEVYVEMGDYARAFTLAEQMRRVDMNDHQQRQLMLVQVKSRIKAGQMDKAREIYQELKKIAPYSTATVEAREAIKEAVLRE